MAHVAVYGDGCPRCGYIHAVADACVTNQSRNKKSKDEKQPKSEVRAEHIREKTR